MSQLSDWYENYKGKAFAALLAKFLMPIFEDVIRILGSEGLLAVQEFFEETKSADGWTKEERRAYMRERLKHVLAEKIGPDWLDRILDSLLEGALDDDTPEAPPEPSFPPEPTDPAPPTDPDPPAPPPSQRGPYETQLTSKPSPDSYSREQDQLWFNGRGGDEARWMVLRKNQLGYPGWTRVVW